MDLKAKMMSAMNKLNSSGDSGSPCLRPIDVSKGCPSLAPSLIREVALMYMVRAVCRTVVPVRTLSFSGIGGTS